ncbi:TonB-dependent receptor [Paracidobacterium acidisoli]|uniref:TonB-dependent receptor n=1 Tax=Paracidobacterium acidisoli TaxID=2303751 RepID=A0A372IRX4_9BACT|nr:TonB-dependent receptor [Paracidobacterium acidisoli]MBT9330598.1 TonB-dependent receptor [Paracidobacterium acidisoli]
MRTFVRGAAFFRFFCLFCVGYALTLSAQSISNSGSISGTVTDPSGALVPGAAVTIQNPVSQYQKSATTDSAGYFQFTNVPFNPYHLTVVAKGFGAAVQDVDVRSGVPVTVPIHLAISGGSSTVVVEGGSDLVENDSTMHTDVDRKLMDKLPLESQSSSVSSLVTLASPGVAADSNGMFHGLGDHAENSFSVDGQPITDQQSKVFSNQIPSSSIQSIQVIDGAPPAEYGDKTSLVIQVTTRSGQGVTRPTGSIYSSYGSFGAATAGFDLSYGKQNWGNFIALDTQKSSRFLDPPEFTVFHDKGNEENVFDRVDYQVRPGDSFHLNLNYSRSWFQTPNTYDNLNIGVTSPIDPTQSVGATDQRSKIGTFDIAPSYTKLLNQYSVLNLGVFVRKDLYNYYPSGNPFADLGPPNLQRETIGQNRSLLNYGVHGDISFAKGIHNAKAGVMYSQTPLRENDQLGIVDYTLNAPCLDQSGAPVQGYSSPSQCAGAGYAANGSFNPNLLPYDLTRGGGLFDFSGRTDVKELALYIEDQITEGNWLFNLGIRGDLYNGLTVARQAEPRLGLAYSIKRTNTVLRTSYARTLETPFNENLVLSNNGCNSDVLAPLLACAGQNNTLNPGYRNEFHAGLQQALGRHFVFSGDYIWKYTHNAYDFSVLGNTPITFPIEWHNSKIPGFALRADLTQVHNFSAYVVMSSVAARFFPPQIGGAGSTVGASGLPFRIDHDERYNETTHMQYQLPGRYSPWYSFNWRFDSGLVAGSVPCYNVTDSNTSCAGTSTTLNGAPAIDLSGLTADQEFEAGLMCNGIRATPTQALPTPCPASELTSNLVKVPAPNTEDDDKNPPRIQPRDLFDMALGEDNLFHGDRYKWGARVTAINVTNKYALYNFLSTFSGTHYVTPRAITGQITFSF